MHFRRTRVAGDPEYDTATPVSAEIEQFWAWMTPGFWQIKLDYRAHIQLTGDWPLAGDKRFLEGDVRVLSYAATESEWQRVISTGLEKLIQNLKSMLKKATS